MLLRALLTARAVAWVALAASLVGCRPPAPPPPPTTALPPSLRLLGSPCTPGTTKTRPGEQDRSIEATCGADGHVSIVVLGGYHAVTGSHNDGWHPSGDSQSYPDEPRFELEAPIQPPPRVLATITLGRTGSRQGPDVTELTVYADGFHLWIKGVDSYAAQFPTAALTVADRRYLTAEDEFRLRDGLGLPLDTPLDDDEALARALQKLPSVPPGRAGHLDRR
jgi:hypothetical protein